MRTRLFLAVRDRERTAGPGFVLGDVTFIGRRLKGCLEGMHSWVASLTTFGLMRFYSPLAIGAAY